MIKLDRPRIIAAASLGLAAVTAFVYWTWKSAPAPDAAGDAKEAAAPREAELPPVAITKVRATRIAPQAAFPGTVISRNDSKLAADVEGRVTWVAEVGTLVSFLVAYAAIAWLLRFVARHPITVFVWYRVTVGVLLAIALAAGVISAT